MEMMVVMSVLAGMAAIAYPMLKSPFGKMKLKAAAQEVSTELSKARIKAMRSGVAQVFQIQLNTGKFQVIGEDVNSSVVPVEDNPSPLNEEKTEVEEKKLSDGIFFDMPETNIEIEDADEQGWTNLAIFYPNGNNTNAVIELADKSDNCVDIKLSGLTGSAKIGDIFKGN